MTTKLALAACLLLVGFILVPGCKKQSEPAPATTEKQVDKAASEIKEQAASAVEQTICPVMGGVVNKDIYVEYKGKKVYFCCESCKGMFEKDPEKYVAKLPQFQK